MYGQKIKPAEIENVRYYFDGVETDYLDAAGVSRRSAELLSLRPALMRLSEGDFDAVIRAFRGLLVSQAESFKDDTRASRSPSYRDAKRLYQMTGPVSGASDQKVSSI